VHEHLLNEEQRLLEEVKRNEGMKRKVICVCVCVCVCVCELVSGIVEEGCRMVSAPDLYSHNLGFLDQSRYFFFQIAPQLYSQG
jgi:hypothetical protein